MISLRRKYKMYIVIGIVLLSIFIALRFSNIMEVFGKKPVTNLDKAKPSKEFEEMENFRKVQISYTVKDYSAFMSEISQLYSDYAIDELDSERKGNYHLFIINFPDSVATEIVAKLRAIPGSQDVQIETRQVPPPLNIEDHKTNLEFTKERYQRSMEVTATADNLSRLQSQMGRVQASIDSLNLVEERYKHNKETSAALVKVSIIASAGMSVAQKVLSFVKNFVLAFLFLTVLFFLIYFGLSIMLRLMSYFGIHTSRSSGSGGYNYYSKKGYGSYGGYGGYGGYGSYGRRRKVKRVYKNKDEDSKDKE